MYTRRITTGAAAAALALLASACSDRLTAPAAHPAALALTTLASHPTLIPNSVRYRDTGGRPATGRSGSATLEALALLGRDGATSLELRAGRADGSEGGVAELAHVQVKALSARGTEKFVTNHHAGLDAPLPLVGLSRGEPLQVQATMRGIDARRTDVVTVTESVKLRPDLEVTLSAPEAVSPGAPVNITAVVAEKNGDLGATASCRLSVDGVMVDQARGIWVDAGDAVSCSFTHVFSQPGTYTVAVSAGATAPADWDESNNAASAPLHVAAPGVALPYTAIVEHKVGYRHAFSAYRYFDGGVPDYEQVVNDTTHERLQTVQMVAFVPGLVIPGPVALEVSQATGGQTVHSARFTAQGAPGYWCASTAEGWTSFFACSQSFGAFEVTHFQYLRYAGTVTYHGVVHTRTWFFGEMREDVYHLNSGHTIAEPLPLGDRFQISVRITGSDGIAYHAEADLPLAAEVREGSTPESCTMDDWGGGLTQETCSSSGFRYDVIYGREQGSQ